MTEEIKINLVNYITGNISDDDKIRIEQWIAEDPSHLELYIQMQEAWNISLLTKDGSEINVGEAYSLLEAKLGLGHSKKVSLLRRLPYLKVAAAIILIIISGVIFFLKNKPVDNKEKSFTESVYVPIGDKKKIILSDSSVVWLNSESVLQVSKGFGVTNRTVYLEGEGYFDVKHNENLVFTVQTKDYTVRDIGTIFNINTYSSDSKFEAAVIEGKISIEGKFSKNKKVSKIYLTRNGVIKIDKTIAALAHTDDAKIVNPIDSSIVKILQVENLDKYAGWKDNLLIFDEDSFKNISKMLERKYNVVILIRDEEIANYRYSGSFNNISNIQSVIEILKETTPANYLIKGDTITISSKK